MTMNSSGPISLAGTTAGQSIELENGGNGTTIISLNDAAVRSLAGVPSGTIVMPTDFWGKSNFNGGQLWIWGRGSAGALGLGNTTSYSSPKQLGSATTWLTTAGGYLTSFAITNTGQLWSWGSNGLGGITYFGGPLGLGDNVERSSPVQVGTLTDWAFVTGGGNSVAQVTAAVKTNGTLWTWGFQGYGGLGQGSTASKNSPVQVGALTNWKTTSVGGYFCAAVKTDGTLWVWGRNNNGQLGLGDTTNRSSPVQVGTDTNWKTVNCAAQNSIMQGVKTNGTLWGWGDNTNGTLGTGNTTSYSSPVQIGSLTTWSNVWNGTGGFGSGFNTALAIKSDGTAWVWGEGISGGLGLGNTTSYSSPKQLGALTTWTGAKVLMGQNSAMVIKSDGTLWTWGRNNYGQLGLGNTTNLSSPVQVGSLTTWQTLQSGNTGNSHNAIKIP